MKNVTLVYKSGTQMLFPKAVMSWDTTSADYRNAERLYGNWISVESSDVGPFSESVHNLSEVRIEFL